MRPTFWLCCVLSLPQILFAAPTQGYVIQWGFNGALDVATPPRQVASDAVAISAGTGHSLALRNDGTVFGWGANFLGMALGYKTSDLDVTNGVVVINGRVLSNVVSIVAGRDFSLALKKDGTVATWGENRVPTGLTNIAAIAGEQKGSWALKRDGTVVGWMTDPAWVGYGQLLPVENLSNVVAIAVGPGGYGTRGVALKRDGKVGHWGSETEYKDATPPAGLSNVVAVSAGQGYTLALKSDGTIVGWGLNEFGEATGVPTTNYSRGFSHYSAGQVRIGGQVLSNIVSIATGRGYSLALKKDGTVVAWGCMDRRYPVIVPKGLSNVVAIAAGAEDFCLAITTNASVASQFRKRVSRE